MTTDTELLGASVPGFTEAGSLAQGLSSGQLLGRQGLAAQLPGRCHPLGLDEPVLSLVQSDDALEVVALAPSLTAYFALRLGARGGTGRAIHENVASERTGLLVARSKTGD